MVDTSGEDDADGLVQPVGGLEGQTTAATGAEPREPEGLIGINIAQARDYPLTQQERL
jgi:hypothetical protein